MLDSYLFIPGDKKKYLDKIDSLVSSHIVVDLEDAVSPINKNFAIELVLQMKPQNNHFVRIPIFENCYSEQEIIKLIQHFEGRIVVPKLSNLSDIKLISSYRSNTDLNMIILIENPICYLNLFEILKSYSHLIKAIGFGTHDFCSITGIKHTFENLENYKRQLILYAKAFNIEYIDGVDLNLDDLSQFRKECLFAYEIGSNGKFLIHPKQIEELNNVNYMTDKELEQIKEVYNLIKDIPDNLIDVYNVNGIVYEKPHIIRIKKLMDSIKKDINKN